MHTCLYINLYTYLYIYRERVTRTHTHIYIEENTRSTPHLCMSIYDVVSIDCKVYMIVIWRQHGIDESIGYLSMITCSFILKSGMKLKTWPTTFGSRCPHKKSASLRDLLDCICIGVLNHTTVSAIKLRELLVCGNPSIGHQLRGFTGCDRFIWLSAVTRL